MILSKEQTNIMGQIKKISAKRKEILLSYLFGSCVDNTNNEESDVDIGIYLDPKACKDFFNTRLILIKEFSQALNREADITILNTTKPFLKYVIIKEGKLAFQRDEGFKIDFEVRTLNEYFDFKPYLDMYHEAILNS